MQEKINRASDVLQMGGTVLLPTDTIWGLACDATNDEACQKILKIKNRPETKSFVILVDSILMLEKYVPEFPEICYDLIDTSTKPLTIVYPSSKGLAKTAIAEDLSVGIRIPNDALCLALLRKFKKPIVATSANISGEAHPKNFSEMNPLILERVDYVLSEKIHEQMTTPSQIIKIGKDSSVQIIRK